MDARRLSPIAAVVLTVGSLCSACVSTPSSLGEDDTLDVSGPTTTAQPTVVAGFRAFSAQDYVALWELLAPFADTIVPLAPPEITGVSGVDDRLRALATARGYRLQGVRTEAELHPDVVEAAAEMVAAAAAEGVTLRVTSGFRSIDDQRQIVLDKLEQFCDEDRGRACTDEELAGGEADDLLEEILTMSSLPGYSSHHTGRVIDLGDDTIEFIEPGSPGHDWISADDFANAKRHGFAPRYPAGVAGQGPDPEPWELFFAGTEVFAP